ncbi:MAG: hypothetical protein DSY33_01180 [Archaeoglobus sp.]|nr:MAG: hypothetical protein DSY33_01180 [Archaeoglobus sp.]
MLEFGDKVVSQEGILKFKMFVKDFKRELEEKKRICNDILSSINIKKIKTGKNKKKWAIKVLDGITAIGVDGSQIQPLREFGIPAGAVQVASFRVEHGKGLWNVRYTSKIVRLEENIDATRYALEMSSLCSNMDGKSYLFYDGGLSPTFAREMSREVGEKYERAAVNAVKRSEMTKTPFIGYIDRSYAKDVARAYGIELYDSFILAEMEVMSYTEPFQSGNICYSYVRFSPSLPSRVEFPAWMKKEFDRFVEVVCAECMLGSTYSYPYVLERAHSYAVITENEKKAILEAVGGISLSFKWISKLSHTFGR